MNCVKQLAAGSNIFSLQRGNNLYGRAGPFNMLLPELLLGPIKNTRSQKLSMIFVLLFLLETSTNVSAAAAEANFYFLSRARGLKKRERPLNPEIVSAAASCRFLVLVVVRWLACSLVDSEPPLGATWKRLERDKQLIGLHRSSWRRP